VRLLNLWFGKSVLPIRLELTLSLAHSTVQNVFPPQLFNWNLTGLIVIDSRHVTHM
jgi:hypothetical protein